jgi:hypothetical protein
MLLKYETTDHARMGGSYGLYLFYGCEWITIFLWGRKRPPLSWRRKRPPPWIRKRPHTPLSWRRKRPHTPLSWRENELTLFRWICSTFPSFFQSSTRSYGVVTSGTMFFLLLMDCGDSHGDQDESASTPQGRGMGTRSVPMGVWVTCPHRLKETLHRYKKQWYVVVLRNKGPTRPP